MKVTTELCDVVSNLMENGYKGEATLTRSYPTGTAGTLAGVTSIQLTGFCKECLYLVHDVESDNLIMTGRYGPEGQMKIDYATVEAFVDIAWIFYKRYKARGFSIPTEWQDLFEKHGKITKQQVTKTVIIEND